jgi:predicted transcriptional regulator
LPNRPFLSQKTGKSPNNQGHRSHDHRTDDAVATDDLSDAVELLIEEKIGGIPVVDEAEGFVGIVTYIDVLRCFLNRLDEERA